MAFCQDTIIKVSEQIRTNSLQHDNTIVIGDNSSGKSYLLKNLVENLMPQNRVYYIDAVNRRFDIEKVLKTGEDPQFSDEIVKYRLRDVYFNIKDSFSYASHDTECVEMIYSSYEKRVQKLFKTITGEKYVILYDESPRKIKLSGGEGILSSGYQALTRIILEVDFFQKTCVQKSRKRDVWMIIDEIDEFLSPRIARRLLPTIMEKYPLMKFIVSTHSVDVVSSIKESNIIVLKDENSEILDGMDYRSQDAIQALFSDIFGSSRDQLENSEVDDRLRILLNQKMNGIWTKMNDDELNTIRSLKLSNSQILVLKQIEEW